MASMRHYIRPSHQMRRYQYDSGLPWWPVVVMAAVTLLGLLT